MQKRQLFRSLMKRKDREDFAAVFENCASQNRIGQKELSVRFDNTRLPTAHVFSAAPGVQL